MPRILCTRPNASDNINGFPFAPHPDGGMVSVDDLPEDVAANFLAVPGYSQVDGPETNTEEPQPPETEPTPPETATAPPKPPKNK